MLLLLPHKKLCSSFAGSSIYSNICDKCSRLSRHRSSYTLTVWMVSFSTETDVLVSWNHPHDGLVSFDIQTGLFWQTKQSPKFQYQNRSLLTDVLVSCDHSYNVLFLFDSTLKQVSFGLFDLLVSLALKPVSFDRWNDFCRSFRRCGIVLVSFDTPTGLFWEMCWSFSIFQTSAMLPRTATHTETHCNTLNVLVAIDASGVRLQNSLKISVSFHVHTSHFKQED